MVAYFSSKLTKQIQALLVASLLLICMLGTHWIGFKHSIFHATVQQQTISQASVNEITSSFSHSSDTCHLFDGLTLASFLAGFTTDNPVVLAGTSTLVFTPQVVLAQALLSAYQSRAPPTFIL